MTFKYQKQASLTDLYKWQAKTETRYINLVRKHKKLKREMRLLQLAHKRFIDDIDENLGYLERIIR